MNVTLQDVPEMMEYMIGKPCVYESRPFGDSTICYRVCGRIFAQLTPKEDWFKITLKTNPNAAEVYRQAYPGIIVRGYHCPPVQQPFWNTVELDRVPKELLYQMIDEAYDEVVKNLPKKLKSRIPLLSGYRFSAEEKPSEELCSLVSALKEELLEECRANTERLIESESSGFLKHTTESILIYHGDEPAGCGSYRFYDDETAEIGALYLKPEARRTGLARELLLRLEASVRIRGFRYGIVYTTEEFREANHLFEKSGYKDIDSGKGESYLLKKKL